KDVSPSPESHGHTHGSRQLRAQQEPRRLGPLLGEGPRPAPGRSAPPSPAGPAGRRAAAPALRVLRPLGAALEGRGRRPRPAAGRRVAPALAGARAPLRRRRRPPPAALVLLSGRAVPSAL